MVRFPLENVYVASETPERGNLKESRFAFKYSLYVKIEEDALLAQKNEPQETQKTAEEFLVTHLKSETNTKWTLNR
jgi:hypothetical protein